MRHANDNIKSCKNCMKACMDYNRLGCRHLNKMFYLVDSKYSLWWTIKLSVKESFKSNCLPQEAWHLMNIFSEILSRVMPFVLCINGLKTFSCVNFCHANNMLKWRDLQSSMPPFVAIKIAQSSPVILVFKASNKIYGLVWFSDKSKSAV